MNASDSKCQAHSVVTRESTGYLMKVCARGVKLSSSALSCVEVASRSLGCLFVFTFFGSGGIFPLSVIRGTHYHMRALAEG